VNDDELNAVIQTAFVNLHAALMFGDNHLCELCGQPMFGDGTEVMFRRFLRSEGDYVHANCYKQVNPVYLWLCNITDRARWREIRRRLL